MVNVKIPKINLLLDIVTPLLLGGSSADSRIAPELRAAPFRGQIRYWLRAKLAIMNIDELRKRESALMGSTSAGSPVRVRVYSEQRLKYGTRELLLHRPNNRLRALGFAENQPIAIELTGRPLDDDLPIDIKQALLLWLNLGGVGKRSRRGMGSLQNRRASIQNGDQLADHIGRILAIPGGELCRLDRTPGATFPTTLSNPPALYPAFIPGCWLVVVCKEAFPSYSDALRDFWHYHLRAGGLRAQYAYGWAARNNDLPEPDGDMRPVLVQMKRRASPFHLHIARSQAGYHLVLTAFNALPDASTRSWAKTLRLMQHVWQFHEGTLFYTL